MGTTESPNHTGERSFLSNRSPIRGQQLKHQFCQQPVSATIALATLSLLLSSAACENTGGGGNTSGRSLWRGLYTPYGELLASATSPNIDGPSYRFTAYESDDALNMFDAGARCYQPKLGRFTGVDPIDPVGVSAFAYARSQPLRYIDPTGRQAELIPDGGEKTQKSPKKKLSEMSGEEKWVQFGGRPELMDVSGLLWAERQRLQQFPTEFGIRIAGYYSLNSSLLTQLLSKSVVAKVGWMGLLGGGMAWTFEFKDTGGPMPEVLTSIELTGGVGPVIGFYDLADEALYAEIHPVGYGGVVSLGSRTKNEITWDSFQEILENPGKGLGELAGDKAVIAVGPPAYLFIGGKAAVMLPRETLDWLIDQLNARLHYLSPKHIFSDLPRSMGCFGGRPGADECP